MFAVTSNGYSTHQSNIIYNEMVNLDKVSTYSMERHAHMNVTVFCNHDGGSDNIGVLIKPVLFNGLV